MAIDYKRDPSCPVCGVYSLPCEVKSTETVRDFLTRFYVDTQVNSWFSTSEFKAINKNLAIAGEPENELKFSSLTLYPLNSNKMFIGTGMLAGDCQANYDMTWGDLVKAGTIEAS